MRMTFNSFANSGDGKSLEEYHRELGPVNSYYSGNLLLCVNETDTDGDDKGVD